jgi:hypothetical protein
VARHINSSSIQFLKVFVYDYQPPLDIKLIFGLPYYVVFPVKWVVCLTTAWRILRLQIEETASGYGR